MRNKFIVVGVACFTILSTLFVAQLQAASQCSVYVQISDVQQGALAGAIFSAELNMPEDTTMVGDTLILPSKAITHTDSDGKAYLWLVPNAILDTSSSYTFEIKTKQDPKRDISKTFKGYVPDSASISIEDILENFKR
jgi:hypothetical protein